MKSTIITRLRSMSLALVLALSAQRQELVVLIALALWVWGWRSIEWFWALPLAFTVPAAILIWYALPSRPPFIQAPAPKKDQP